MDAQTLYDALLGSPEQFVTTLCYRSQNDIKTDALSQDSHVLLLSDLSGSKHAIWRALYDAVTEPETDILFVTPTKSAADGTILMIEDEIDRSQFDTDLWGIDRTTESRIEFTNGSRITARAAGENVGNAPANIRGYTCDRLFIDTWEDGDQIPTQTIEDVIVPMVGVSDATVWCNDTQFRETELTDYLLDNGVYVDRLIE
jgi:hypothetical protein